MANANRKSVSDRKQDEVTKPKDDFFKKTEEIQVQESTSKRGRPKNEEKLIPRTYYLSQDLVDAIKLTAFHKDCDISSIVRAALYQYIPEEYFNYKK